MVCEGTRAFENKTVGDLEGFKDGRGVSGSNFEIIHVDAKVFIVVIAIAHPNIRVSEGREEAEVAKNARGTCMPGGAATAKSI